MPLTFKEAVCRHLDIRVEDYETEVIRRSLHSHARRIWPLLEIFGGKATFSSRQLVGMAANTLSREDLIDVINEYYKDFKPSAGFLFNRLKIGVSCRKLLALHDDVRRSKTHQLCP
ncbi:MAG: hypothetical protein ACXWJB_04980 [Limisphaerales bacterium]